MLQGFFLKKKTWLNKYQDDGGWFVQKEKMMDINVPKAHTMDEEGKLK